MEHISLMMIFMCGLPLLHKETIISSTLILESNNLWVWFESGTTTNLEFIHSGVLEISKFYLIRMKYFEVRFEEQMDSWMTLLSVVKLFFLLRSSTFWNELTRRIGLTISSKRNKFTPKKRKDLWRQLNNLALRKLNKYSKLLKATELQYKNLKIDPKQAQFDKSQD